MAKSGFKVLDSDMHIMEPPDLWQRFTVEEFRDQAPRGVTSENVRDLGTIHPDGTPWGALRLGRQPQPTASQARGHTYDKFYGTHLDLALRSLHIDRLMLTGITTDVCVNSTLISASTRNYRVTAVTDGMFMTSRNGNHFNVWPESFIRPGLRLTENWFYGDNYQAIGLLETNSHIEGAERELSIYSQEAVEQAENVERLRRFTMRIDGFVSINARLRGGEVLTEPLTFQGSQLALNFSTGAAGGVRVEVQDAGGTIVPGYALDDCHEVWGDDLARIVKWEGGSDVSGLAGQPVRLRIHFADADLYSIQFR